MAYIVSYRVQHKQNNCCVISESDSPKKIRYGIKWRKEVEKGCNDKQYRTSWNICIFALAPVSQKADKRLELIFKVLYEMPFGFCIVFHCCKHIGTLLRVFNIRPCKIYKPTESFWYLHYIYCILK